MINKFGINNKKENKSIYQFKFFKTNLFKITLALAFIITATIFFYNSKNSEKSTVATPTPISQITAKQNLLTANDLHQKESINHLPEEIIGEKVILKYPDLKYYKEYHEMLSSTVKTFLEFPQNLTEEEIYNFLEDEIEQVKQNKMVLYFIFDKKTNKFIGSIEIKEKNEENPGQVSFWINEQFWGGGRFQEALDLITTLYFKYTHAAKYDAHVRIWNKRSYYALKKYGFKDVGIYKEKDPKENRYILEIENPFLKNKTETLTNITQNKGDNMTKKILFILMPENFRDEEFSDPYNMLKSKGYHIDVAGFKEGEAIGTGGLKFTPNLQLDNLSDKDLLTYDALVIPGGSASTKYLWNNKKIQHIIRLFYENQKIVATICYASIAPAQAGILTNKNATVYPTQEAKKIFEEYSVVFNPSGCVTLTQEKIITAQSPKYTKEFGQAIIDLLE